MATEENCRGPASEFECILARQPICDRELRLVGYELLYRPHCQSTCCTEPDPEYATAQVMITAMTEVGMDLLSADVPCFINMTKDALNHAQSLSLSASSVVFEVLEDVVIDEYLVNSVKALAERGYTIALDDFVYSEAAIPLLECADIVKVDIRAFNTQALIHQVNLLRRFSVKLLAEKVETWQEYRMCKKLGFELFQGYFFASPEMLNGKKAPHNRISTLRLLIKLNDPQVSFVELETLVSQDPFIYYKLLRYINSAYTGMGKVFHDIKSILIFLGLEQLRTLVCIMALSRMTDKPPMLFLLMLQRAKFCELMAEQQRLTRAQRNAYFTTGLFSLLETCLDIPAQQLFHHIPLCGSVKTAILKKQGHGGKVLQCAIAIECQQQFDYACCNVTEQTVKACHYEAVNWAYKQMNSVLLSSET
ncbi:EAL and HDOD domain-containing protein [Pseudoalteromonas obscura]|uniref:EAL domain-containing protein n=1 Tax=Pseudoalteromonas obscura TaxID=3048491 RepID=A0ABT7EKR8_9GAMM|nr:EAL domain-containing protein [Pseudoalteromonas sp. P94(2023)]MDK2595619.1 EAL domain-containing protein [Pseudoalteromonas sp. P94(2023)]